MTPTALVRPLAMAVALAPAALAPAAAAQTWTNADVRGLGYVNGLLAHPETATVYARTDVGGVYRWDGARWDALLDGTHTRTRAWSPAVESFALDPQVPGRLWVALGDDLGSGPTAAPVIARSDDDGRTWAATAFPTDVPMSGNGYWRRAGERLAVDPNNSDVVYFGSRLDGLWRTDDGGASWARVAGFSSLGDDGGPGDGPCAEPQGDGCGPGGLTFVVFDGRTTATRDGQTVTANVYVGALGDGVWRSADGGQTWALALPGPGTRDNPMRGAFAHGRLYVALTGDGGGGGDGGALMTYTPDASGPGGTVADKTPPEPCPLYGEYAWNAFVPHPTDPDLAVAITYGINVRKVFFSRDIAADAPTWEIQTDEGPYEQCPAQQLDYVVSPVPWGEADDGAYSYGGAGLFDVDDPRRFWVSNGYGVYRFDDLLRDGTTLRFVEVMEGLEETCAHDVAAPGGAGPDVYSAMFDTFGFPHASVGELPATSFDRGVQQNGTDVATTPADPLVAVAVGARNGGYLPASRITRDGGRTWADLPGLGDPTDPADACVGFLTAGNVAISATDPDRMVWSPQRIIYPACNGYRPFVTPPHVTSDAGRTWRPVQGYTVPSGNWAAGGDFVVSQHLVADAVDGDAFYAYVKVLDPPFGTELWRSRDGGETWANACDDCLPDFRFPRLQAHPQTAGEVWGVFRKLYDVDAQAELHRSTDYGASWSRVTSADSVWAFGFGAPLPGRARATVYAHAMVGGAEGVYYSTDDAATWTRFGGTDNVPIGLFEGMVGDPDEPGVVYAGSGCRGVWQGSLGLATAAAGGPGGRGLELAAPRPNPSAGADGATVRTAVRVGAAGGPVRLTLADALGRVVWRHEVGAAAGAEVPVELRTDGLAPGLYTLRASAGDAAATRRLTVVR